MTSTECVMSDIPNHDKRFTCVALAQPKRPLPNDRTQALRVEC